MTTPRPIPNHDDHGDQFPGALPGPATPARDTQHRLVRMQAAYVHKINALAADDEVGPADELAGSFDEESANGHAPQAHPDRRSAGRHTPGRAQGGRPPGRVSRFTRHSLEQFDRYTLDVFNAGAPYRYRDDRPV